MSRPCATSDPLRAAFGHFDLDCAVGGPVTLRAPWCLRGDADLGAGFYAITRGRCWLESPFHATPVRLNRGDLVVFPHGVDHRLTSGRSPRPPRTARSLRRADIETGRRLQAGGSGPVTGLIRVNLEVAEWLEGPLPVALSAPILLPGGGPPPAPWLVPALAAVAADGPADLPGRGAMERLLGAAVLVQCLRASLLASSEGGVEPIAAVVDPRIGPVLARLHAEPGQPWTLSSLAREAGLSRSIFAERFRRIVGVPPKRYLFECRMRSAGRLLRTGQESIKVIALRTGYASEPAFSSAFKRWSGRAPGTWRDEPARSTTIRPAPGRPDHLSSPLTPGRRLPH